MGKFHRIADRRDVERDGCGRTRLKWNGPGARIVYENAHEPLIDQDILDRAQRALKERRDRTLATGFLSGKGKVSPYLLSGLIRCGACGGSMHGRTTWNNMRQRQAGGKVSQNPSSILSQLVSAGSCSFG